MEMAVAILVRRVWESAVRKQDFGHTEVASVVEWSPSSGVCGIDVGTTLDQSTNDSRRSCDMKGGAAVDVLQIHVCAFFSDQSRYLGDVEDAM